MMGESSPADLEAVEIHDVLSNERRQMVLDRLRDSEGTMSARDLSEYIAERETGESPPPRNIRQSAYVSLHQTHLPKLDELGIVEYDESEKTVTLDEAASREVSVYMETVPKYGISWSEYYLGVSLLGLLLFVAARLDVPVVSSAPAAGLTGAVLVLIAVSAAYQTVQQGSSILHRLGAVGSGPTEEDEGSETGAD
jgi:hypothetical protein